MNAKDIGHRGLHMLTRRGPTLTALQPRQRAHYSNSNSLMEGSSATLRSSKFWRDGQGSSCSIRSVNVE